MNIKRFHFHPFEFGTGFFLALVLMGGGGAESVNTNFICENNRKSNKIMHCVFFFFLSGSFEDRAIFHEIIYRSVMGT